MDLFSHWLVNRTGLNTMSKVLPVRQYVLSLLLVFRSRNTFLSRSSAAENLLVATLFVFLQNKFFLRHKVLSESVFCPCQKQNFFPSILLTEKKNPKRNHSNPPPFKLNGWSLTAPISVSTNSILRYCGIQFRYIQKSIKHPDSRDTVLGKELL